MDLHERGALFLQTALAAVSAHVCVCVCVCICKASHPFQFIQVAFNKNNYLYRKKGVL